MRPSALSLIALAALAGCGGGPAPIASDRVARQSLAAALDAWKAGKPAASLAEARPKIEAVDFEWRARKVLADYAIGEATPGQGTRTFAASLTIQGEPAAKEVRYMVLGLDPVLIFRDEDFRRFLDMANGPGPPRKARR